LSSHLQFLRNLQQVLEEGSFAATYKYALLQSLADLAVESEPNTDGSMRLPVSKIADKFIQYYWRQSVPYSGPESILRQNTGQQAAIVNYVAEVRAEYGSLAKLQQEKGGWRGLNNQVARVVRKMPLWKLQILPGGSNEFLYRESEFEDDSIRLLPDAVTSFRDLYVIVTNFVRGAWVSQIQSIGVNRDILGAVAGLQEFLFGTERSSLDSYRSILREYQQSRCFYCVKEARNGDLDHFIPWSRYPVDLGHNFVFAHASCNREKRDFLADIEHLAKWNEDNLLESGELTNAFVDAGLIQDKIRSRHVAIWAYEQGEASGAHVWAQGNDPRRLRAAWRDILNV
jgi:hypothetical protein